MPVEIGRREPINRAMVLPERGPQPQDGAWKQGGSLITDHAHEVQFRLGLPDQEWMRCMHCGLGEAAHSSTIGAIPF